MVETTTRSRRDRSTFGAGLVRRLVALSFALAVASPLGCMTPVPDPDELSEQDQKLQRARARRDLGIDYLAKGQNAVALRELNFSLEENPDDPVTLLWIGEGYRRQAHNDKALDAMTRAIELRPSFREAHNNLSAFYLQLERWEEARKHAQVLIDDPLYSRPWMAYSNRGWAEYNLGQIDKARKSLETALEFRSDFWPAALNLGILEREAGNTLKAVKYFQRVIDHPVGQAPRAQASFNVAQILVAMGHREKAIRYFSASVKNDPEGRWAEESRDYLKILR